MVSHSKLTAPQNKIVTEIGKDIVKACLSTSPIDRGTCLDAIGRAYAHLGLGLPEIVFVDSPIQAIARLQERSPVSSRDKASSMSEPLSRKDHANLGSLVLNMISAALPRRGLAFGDEVDLSFHDELNRSMDETWRLPIWRALSNAVDKKLGDVIHYAHAVTSSLEEAVTYQEHKWLIYSGGSASVWNGAEGFTRVRALFEIGVIKNLPDGYALGLEVLRSCGWLNAFEKLCVVCDRPIEMSQSGSEKDPAGLRTRVTWRDGKTCSYTFT